MLFGILTFIYFINAFVLNLYWKFIIFLSSSFLFLVCNYILCFVYSFYAYNLYINICKFTFSQFCTSYYRLYIKKITHCSYSYYWYSQMCLTVLAVNVQTLFNVTKVRRKKIGRTLVKRIYRFPANPLQI